jgi:deoxyguanosine kinase
MKQPTLIAIAGIIGVGKTTLAHGLAQTLNAELILEEYDKNPFLPGQYAHQPDAALASQLFFLLSRIRQLDKKNLQPNTTYISDYIYNKDRIFAQLNLEKPHFDLYCQLAEKLQPSLTAPSAIIYLSDSVENCLKRIKKRGRDYEKNIAPNWLENLSQAYQTHFKNWEKSPLIKINCTQQDLRDPQTAKNIANKLENGKITL